jgi:hypothetical protein
MTLLQEKLIEASRLLIEIRGLAVANGKLYRQNRSENLALARAFEHIAHDLEYNRPISISSLADAVEMHVELLTETPDIREIERDTSWVFRRQPNMLKRFFGDRDILKEVFGGK